MVDGLGSYQTPSRHLPYTSHHPPNTSQTPPTTLHHPPTPTSNDRNGCKVSNRHKTGPSRRRRIEAAGDPRGCRRVLRKLDSFSGNTRVPGLPCCRSGPTTRAHHAQAPWLEPRLTFSVCIVTASQSTPTAATKPGANGAGQTPAFTWWSSHGASGGHGFSRYEARDT